MSWTKRQLIEQAFEEIGFASYAYDLSAEQLRGALRRLDSMLGTWDEKGIKFGYPLTSLPIDSDLDTLSNAPNFATEAIYLNLAIRLASPLGKVAPRELKVDAKSAYNTLLGRYSTPTEMQLPRSMPSGAGNKPGRWNRQFLNTPDTSPIRIGDDGQLDFTE